MKWGVVRFPGSLDDGDSLYALARRDGPGRRMLWHKDESLGGVECVCCRAGSATAIICACGAIARFSPIMKSVAQVRRRGRAGDRHLQRLSDSVRGASAARRADAQPLALLHLRAGVGCASRTRARRLRARRKQGELLRLPIKHGEGLYVAPEDELRQMEERGQVILRYVDADGRESDDANPNGSMRAIAGVANERFNVFGLMPHPEHAVEAMLGGVDGLQDISVDSRERAMSERPVSIPGEPKVDLEQARAHGLAPDEYRKIEQIIGRTPDLHRARRVLGDVVGALLVQIVAPSSEKAAVEERTRWCRGRARTPAQSTSATDGRRSSKSKATTILRSSSRTRARRPASAESCANFHDGRAAGGEHELAQVRRVRASAHALSARRRGRRNRRLRQLRGRADGRRAK